MTHIKLEIQKMIKFRPVGLDRSNDCTLGIGGSASIYIKAAHHAVQLLGLMEGTILRDEDFNRCTLSHQCEPSCVQYV